MHIVNPIGDMARLFASKSLVKRFAESLGSDYMHDSLRDSPGLVFFRAGSAGLGFFAAYTRCANEGFACMCKEKHGLLYGPNRRFSHFSCEGSTYSLTLAVLDSSALASSIEIYYYSTIVIVHYDTKFYVTRCENADFRTVKMRISARAEIRIFILRDIKFRTILVRKNVFLTSVITSLALYYSTTPRMRLKLRYTVLVYGTRNNRLEGKGVLC